MSAAASSSTVKRHGRKMLGPSPASMALAAPYPPLASSPRTVAHSVQPPAGMLPLVPCPSCGIRSTIRLGSKSETNPGRIFYKCPNHHIPPNPCQHYYWEDGPDNYFDFLVRGGYISHGLSSFDSAGVIASEEIEVQEECAGAMQNLIETVVNADVLKKMNELIFLCKSILSALVVLIAVVVYVGFKK
ncbi:hypothetical protein ZWY2020_056278 [Hordeum vulgare]|nr:hypothetical protein ZWY2020_056278 [Hordeum vulgare]